MAVNRVATLVMIWSSFAALAVSAQTWAPTPSLNPGDAHKEAATTGTASFHTTMFGFVAAVVSFFAIKKMI